MAEERGCYNVVDVRTTSLRNEGYELSLGYNTYPEDRIQVMAYLWETTADKNGMVDIHGVEDFNEENSIYFISNTSREADDPTLALATRYEWIMTSLKRWMADNSVLNAKDSRDFQERVKAELNKAFSGVYSFSKKGED